MSRWKCVSRPDIEKKNFTVGNVYELDDNTDELTGDSGYRYGRNHVNADCGGTIAFLQGCKVMFEEVKVMFGKDDLRTGMLVKFRNGNIGVVMLNDAWGCSRIVAVNDASGSSAPHVSCYDEDLDFNSSTNNRYDIMEVRKPKWYPDLSHVDQEFKHSEVIWRREEPKELTVKQIEELLGYAVKIVKEGE